ncbi:MAG: tRNA lysidine(34) synthetase TilS [Deltaproteobacteria bacterium]|nr:tRNA lysidine(34) synthetase TilS [Deltaproteobacteria bacterium]
MEQAVGFLDLDQESEQNFSVMVALENSVKETIRKHSMLAYGDGVLAAVSGGPDSVALLHILVNLRTEWGLRLEVTHLQHGIRGEDARDDAALVAELANKLSLPFHLKEIDLPRIRLAQGKGNLEAMAREERYRFFAAVAEQHGLQKVALGHTWDDQIETLFMWLLRGSGSRGLMGMPPVRSLHGKSTMVEEPWLIRPLIETPKKEVLEYLSAEGLPYRTDQSNLDPNLLRNWIRLHLLPHLREKTDRRFDERMSRMAEVLRGEDEILERLTRSEIGRVVCGGSLLRDALLREEKGMQRRLFRFWLAATRGDLRRIDFHHVEKALEFIAHGPPQGRLSIPGGWNLVKRYGNVRLQKARRKQRSLCYTYTLPREGELVVEEAGMKLRISRRHVTSNLRPEHGLEALFDLAVLPEDLTVRNFRRGDRFEPIGMGGGHKKIKDLFMDKKIPLDIRRVFPLLVAGDEILWIPGYGRSEIAKITPDTTEVLSVKAVSSGGLPAKSAK